MIFLLLLIQRDNALSDMDDDEDDGLKPQKFRGFTDGPKHGWAVYCSDDDSISGFQFQYDIDTIFWKYRGIDIDIFKMISM